MSYVNQKSDPRSRATAIASVIAIHAGIGAIIVTGLTVAGVVAPPEPNLGGEQIPLPPPPPTPEPTPEPSATAEPRVPAPAPLPPIPIPRTPEIDRTIFDDSDPIVPAVPLVVPLPGPSLTPPPPPSPTPSFTPRAAQPSNDISRWISTEDYPSRPLRSGIEGQVRYRLDVDTRGRVDKCSILSSAGNADLDRQTCRLIERRARFEPASDGTGGPIAGSFTGTVTWQIPD